MLGELATVGWVLHSQALGVQFGLLLGRACVSTLGATGGAATTQTPPCRPCAATLPSALSSVAGSSLRGFGSAIYGSFAVAARLLGWRRACVCHTFRPHRWASARSLLQVRGTMIMSPCQRPAWLPGPVGQHRGSCGRVFRESPAKAIPSFQYPVTTTTLAGAVLLHGGVVLRLSHHSRG